MKKFLAPFILFGLIFPVIFQTGSVACSTEIQNRSSENIIYERVKSGIVTILGANFGSGFLIDDNGLILTNYHVVKDQEETLRVRLNKGIVLKADIVATSPQDDLAIIRVNLKALKYKPYVFSISNQNEIYVGQKVITIASQIDYVMFDKILTQGVVSKINPPIIYHDIALKDGDGGSPLINTNGDVVGINNFKVIGSGKTLSTA
jgi:serine protease Do